MVLKRDCIIVLKRLFDDGMEDEYNVMCKLFEEHFGYSPMNEVVFGMDEDL
ncbi:hypothetical protein [Bacillus sp. NPDC094106]|uniref:hypothetical protein n=1 Tax=Bacillus sp. NPDC094106 TaxID=3363949 RepID=UPI0037F7901A